MKRKKLILLGMLLLAMLAVGCSSDEETDDAILGTWYPYVPGSKMAYYSNPYTFNKDGSLVVGNSENTTYTGLLRQGKYHYQTSANASTSSGIAHGYLNIDDENYSYQIQVNEDNEMILMLLVNDVAAYGGYSFIKK